MMWFLAIAGVLGAIVALPLSFALLVIIALVSKLAGALAGRALSAGVVFTLIAIPFVGWSWLQSLAAEGADGPRNILLGFLYFVAVGTCIFSVLFLLVGSIESRRSGNKIIKKLKKARA
jgi:hypothetical protein